MRGPDPYTLMREGPLCSLHMRSNTEMAAHVEREGIHSCTMLKEKRMRSGERGESPQISSSSGMGSLQALQWASSSPTR